MPIQTHIRRLQSKVLYKAGAGGGAGAGSGESRQPQSRSLDAVFLTPNLSIPGMKQQVFS